VSELVRTQVNMEQLAPHEATLIINALVRTGTLDEPLLLRLFDSLRRQPMGAWAVEDVVRVADAFVRLRLERVAPLSDLGILERAKEELLRGDPSALGSRALCSLAVAADGLPALNDARVWQHLAIAAQAIPPASYSVESISLLASVLSHPIAKGRSPGPAASSSAGLDAAASQSEDAGSGAAAREAPGPEPLGERDDFFIDISSRLYQCLLAAVQSTPPQRLGWDCLGSLVTAELQHRRSERQVVLTPDSSIEFAVKSALAAFQGASLLRFAKRALYDSQKETYSKRATNACAAQPRGRGAHCFAAAAAVAWVGHAARAAEFCHGLCAGGGGDVSRPGGGDAAPARPHPAGAVPPLIKKPTDRNTAATPPLIKSTTDRNTAATPPLIKSTTDRNTAATPPERALLNAIEPSRRAVFTQTSPTNDP
jgi:hypothetical protein